MVTQFSDPAWWDAFTAELNADPQWQESAKYFQVRIGVNAPKTVSVHREEIFDRIKGERSDEPAHAKVTLAAVG